MPSLQETYGLHSACFGCGPANERGLRIQSFPDGTELVAHFTPEQWHEAFPGVLNGGIAGALLDCHANWTAAWHLMTLRGLSEPPCTVTAEFSVKLPRPTPTTRGPLELRAHATHVDGDKVEVEATLSCAGKVGARCTGTFVSVKPGHPAYHRWGSPI